MLGIEIGSSCFDGKLFLPTELPPSLSKKKKIPNSKEYREALFKEQVCLQVEQICQLIMAIHPHTGPQRPSRSLYPHDAGSTKVGPYGITTTLSLWGWNQCQGYEWHTKYKLTRKQALEQAQRGSFTSRSNGNTEPLLCHSLHTHLTVKTHSQGK